MNNDKMNDGLKSASLQSIIYLIIIDSRLTHTRRSTQLLYVPTSVTLTLSHACKWIHTRTHPTTLVTSLLLTSTPLASISLLWSSAEWYQDPGSRVQDPEDAICIFTASDRDPHYSFPFLYFFFFFLLIVTFFFLVFFFLHCYCRWYLILIADLQIFPSTFSIHFRFICFVL